MKKTIQFMAAIAILFIGTSLVQAQFYSSYQTLGVPTTITNIVTSGVTNILGPLVSQNVTISTTVTFPTGGGTNVYAFAPSVDGVHYDVTAADELFATNMNTTSGTQTSLWTVNTKGAIFLKLVSITGTVTANTTNVSVSYGIKAGGP